MFQFPQFPQTWLCVHHAVCRHAPAWVSPFGYLRLTGCTRLIGAFRSVPRPSSALGAKSFTIRPCSFAMCCGEIVSLALLCVRRLHDGARATCLRIISNMHLLKSSSEVASRRQGMNIAHALPSACNGAGDKKGSVTCRAANDSRACITLPKCYTSRVSC